ncbi:MAG: hypothetical protein IMF06_02720 [Proteobacteria bacterium]|nr:hypothetical protein [Pseudomonadota bacterium]
MISAFDRIVIAVPDLAAGMEDYQCLLGANFWLLPGERPPVRAWLGLANVVLELCEKEIESPAIVGLVFTGDGHPGTPVNVTNARQLALSICDGNETAMFRREQPAAQNPGLKVDHLVLRTGDADDCVNLFSVGLGIRFALDRDAPQWGGRMLFFRVGKLTLEVIEPTDDKPEKDYFWGIAYQCPDISTTAATLRQRGVELSEVRDGRKPGTKVATIKSHSLALPTLLIEPAIRV